MTSTMKPPLLLKIRLATILMWLWGLLAVGPFLYAVFRLITASTEPGGDDQYLAIIFTLFTWGVVLLFPLLGFSHALAWRRTLQSELPKIANDAEP